MTMLLLAVLSAHLAVEIPNQLVLEPPSVGELAGAAAVSWDGQGVVPLRSVVRRLPGALRVVAPPGVRAEALHVEVRAENLRPKEGSRGRGGELAVHVTVLPLRLVQETLEGSVWEGDLLVILDPAKAEAGDFHGQLNVTVSLR